MYSYHIRSGGLLLASILCLCAARHKITKDILNNMLNDISIYILNICIVIFIYKKAAQK